jgi:hypothetical protein
MSQHTIGMGPGRSPFKSPRVCRECRALDERTRLTDDTDLRTSKADGPKPVEWVVKDNRITHYLVYKSTREWKTTEDEPRKPNKEIAFPDLMGQNAAVAVQ